MHASERLNWPRTFLDRAIVHTIMFLSVQEWSHLRHLVWDHMTRKNNFHLINVKKHRSVCSSYLSRSSEYSYNRRFHCRFVYNSVYNTTFMITAAVLCQSYVSILVTENSIYIRKHRKWNMRTDKVGDSPNSEIVQRKRKSQRLLSRLEISQYLYSGFIKME